MKLVEGTAPLAVKAFRLFVSSTFADFGAERELLQSKVFPELDAYCAAKGCQFYPLDLRWGVNEEAQLDQRTAEICLGEVRAAKAHPPPNFLILIGNRYGWVPLPYAIAQDEFETVVAWLEAHDQQDAARALGALYQHDDNHLVPRGLSVTEPDSAQLISAYTLRSREDEIPELKPADQWAIREAQVRCALQEAAEDLLKRGRIDDAAHDKFFLSLTEQEIIVGCLRGNDGSEAGISSSPPSPGTGGPHAIAFIREIVGSANNGRESIFRDIEQEPRLEALKNRLKRALPDESIVAARATWQESGRLDPTYLTAFAAQIQSKLEAAIDKHIAGIEAVERSPNFALQNERAEHHAFGEQKRKIFIGRDSNLATIARHIAGRADHPLILHGRSGLGKSALMASAVTAAKAAGSVPVVYRFIGASAGSSDIRSLLISLLEDLADQGIAQKPDEFNQDADKFGEQIKTLLLSLTKPVVTFLDALDQLRKPYRVDWLPAKLPPAVKIVVSVLDDAAYETDSSIHRTLRQRLAPEAFLEIESLGAMQGRNILLALEREARRRLHDSQRDYIIGQFEKAGASPLYLRTAFEIAGSWKRTDKAGAGRHVLAQDTAAIIAQLIKDLSDVYHHEPELVTRTLGYLAAAKDGLSTKELTDVLSRDQGVMRALSSEQHGAYTDKLPPSVWVRLSRQLAPFLVEKRIDDQPLLQLFHRQVADVAREQHYEPVKIELHAALAGYFESRGIKREGGADYDRRSLSELPYQLHHAEDPSRLAQILLSPDWMQQKLAALGPQTLVADYMQFARDQFQTLIGRTLQLITGICARDKRQLLPQLLGRLTACTDPAALPFLDQTRRLVARPAILELRQSLTTAGAEMARLEGHTGIVFELMILPDGRVASGSEDNTIRLWDLLTGAETARLEGHARQVNTLTVLLDGRLASGSEDNTIRLWDLKTGAETGRLEGHPGAVSTLTVLPDGRLASGAEDNTIRLWDVNSGTETARLIGHTDTVHILRMLPDGRLASGSEDNTIRLWDLKTGAETARLIGHTKWVSTLTVISDSRLVSGSGDCTIRVWDLHSGAETRRFDGHTELVTTLAVLPDGRMVSGSGDATIRLWNVDSGAEIARLEGHARQVNTLTVLSNGRLVSGSDDKTIRLWNLESSAETTGLAAHTKWITTLMVLPDGRLISGSADKTIRLWEPETGAEIARLQGHAGTILELAVLPDGRLVSGSTDNTIRVWDPNSGSETARLDAHAKRVTTLAVLPDGRLASACDDNLIRLWDVHSGAETARLAGHTKWITTLTVLPDGRLGSASSDNTIRLWDTRTGAETARLEGHTDGVYRLTVLPDGRLCSLSGDRTIRLWDPMTGTETARLHNPTSEVNVLMVLPHGLLATACDDDTIRLWDVAGGAETARLRGHASTAYALAVLLDGRLATGSDDRTIRLWDPRTGREISRLEIDAAVYCLAALPNDVGKGSRLVAGDEIGRLHWLEILE